MKTYEVEVTAYPKTYEVKAQTKEEAIFKATKLADSDGKWLSYSRSVNKK